MEEGFYGTWEAPAKMALTVKSVSLDDRFAPAQMARFGAPTSPDGGVGDGAVRADGTQQSVRDSWDGVFRMAQKDGATSSPQRETQMGPL